MSAPAAGPTLVLRDIHVPPAPPWWPPAPGWWLLAAALLVLAAGAASWAWRRAKRREALRRAFDEALSEAVTPAAQVAAMSALLRRAARARDPRAATLQGDAWLARLDQGRPPLFEGEWGQCMLEGGFRKEVPQATADALRPRVRQRFLEWMGAA